MSGPSRQEVLRRCVDEYKESSWLEKGDQLDQFVKLTGYSRKYLISVLNIGDKPVVAVARRGRPHKYGEEATLALVQLWESSGCICSKRLVPFLPGLVDSLERFGHLRLASDVRGLVLNLSIATADRLLEPARSAQARGLSTTKPNRILRKQIPLRTHNGCDDIVTGFFEVDLVAHCGGRIAGSYLHTLDLTDIVTGWTECISLRDRQAETVLSGIMDVRARLPFELLGLDTDNGGEFINEILLNYCHTEKLVFTRSRAYKKNDQARIEERNGSVVRRLVGYDRFDGEEAGAALNDLYNVLRLHQNYYQPSLKLISKERDGGHVTKKYDRAKTPLQRLLDAGVLSEERAAAERAIFQALDPLHLLSELNRLQDYFWTFSWNCNAAIKPIAKPPEKIEAPSEGSGSKGTPVIHLELTVAQGAPDKTDLAPPAPLEGALCVIVPIEEHDILHQDSVLPAAVVVHDLMEPTSIVAAQHAIKAPRNYRRTKRPINMPAYQGQSTAFVEEWNDIDEALHRNPHMSARRLMLELEKLYPGRYAEGQYRTLARRISKWRLAHPEYAGLIIPGASLPRGLVTARAEAASAERGRLNGDAAPGLCAEVGFANVWDTVISALKEDPYLSGRALFLRLQEAYPGRFRTGQQNNFALKLGFWRRESPENAKPRRAPKP